MTRDNSTATQAQTGRNLGRRAFVAGIGASAAGAGAISLEGGPVQDSEAIAPLLLAGAVGVAAGAAGGVAFGATFGGPDGSEVDSAIAYQTAVDEFTRAREDNLLLSETIASLKRDISLVENKAREQAIFRIYEEGIDGGTTTTATNAAEKAINDAYGVVERAILKSWNTRRSRVNAIHSAYQNADPGGVSNPDYWAPHPDLAFIDDSGSVYNNFANIGFGNYKSQTKNHVLVDGSNIDVFYETGDTSNGVGRNFDPLNYTNYSGQYVDTMIITKPDPSVYGSSSDPPDVSYNQVVVLETKRWADMLTKLFNEHSTLIGEVSTMVSNYFQPAKDGNLDLTNAVGPAYLSDSAKNATDYMEAAQALRSLGYPISDQRVTIEIPNESGGTLELVGKLAWTAHNGNGLVVGQTLNFGNFPGSLMAAVNNPEGQRDSSTEGPGAQLIEITGEVTITTAEGANEVTFENRSLAEQDATTNEEIEQIFKENQQANEKANQKVYDSATVNSGGGGGGGFLDFGGGDNRTLGLIAGGAAILLLLANDDE